jgi:VanZ family protein
MLQRLIIVTAWASGAALAYATLTRVGFMYSIYYRLAPFLMWPAMRSLAHLEHVVAFAVLGALFSFAYPKRIIFACCVIVSSAIILECLQTLTPDRHGTLIDAFEKMAGGLLGIFAATAIHRSAKISRLFQN